MVCFQKRRKFLKGLPLMLNKSLFSLVKKITPIMYTVVNNYLFLILLFTIFLWNSLKINSLFSFYFVLSTFAFFAALASYMCSDFETYNVFTNSNVLTPLFYKISATWSNHEGSFLLWCWLLSLYGFGFQLFVQGGQPFASHKLLRVHVQIDHLILFRKKSNFF